MAFNVDHQNYIRQLVELSVSAEQTNDPFSVDLNVTLMVQPDEIEIGDYTVEVGFAEAFLTLETHGCSADQATKFGMRRIAGKTSTRAIEKSVKASVSNATANEAVATGKISVVAASLQASAKSSSSRTETTDVTMVSKEDETIEYLPVEAIGNDRWKVACTAGDQLGGFYMTDERLCRLVKATKPSNRFGASLALKVRRRDIGIAITKNRTFLGLEKNKEKLLALMVARHLGGCGSHDEQSITFSEAVADDQG